MQINKKRIQMFCVLSIIIVATTNAVFSPVIFAENEVPESRLVHGSDKKINTMITAAKSGDPIAQNNLGYRYYHGLGVQKDLSTAFLWFMVAAEQGQPNAQTSIASAYRKGWGGIKKDFAQSYYWYSKAAAQGLDRAQYSLGIMYESGFGLKSNLSTAKYYFRLAKRQGHLVSGLRLDAIKGDPDAAYTLGMYYLLGTMRSEGVVMDLTEALLWFLAAERLGDYHVAPIVKIIKAKVSLEDQKQARHRLSQISKFWDHCILQVNIGQDEARG
jgi:TPR repeat protein